MGSHYVPQHYLRHFATQDDPNSIWMYYKRPSKKKPESLPIPIVAQSRGFYTDADERALSEAIEGPAQRPLTSLRNGEILDSKERKAVALYLESMIKRVPFFRSILIALVPDTKESLIADVLNSEQTLSADFDLTTAALREQIDRWNHALDDTGLLRTHPAVIGQWSDPDIVDSLYSMTWRVIKSEWDCFLTSDNPVFFDDGLGLQNQHSELSLPLSSNVALHANRQGPRAGLLFVMANQSVIEEINRRSAFRSHRFAFYHKDSAVVSSLVAMERIPVHQMMW